MFISNWVFRPAPGTQAEAVQSSKDATKLWQKHSANECHLLVLSGADIGCMSFIAQFDNAEDFGKANDGISADPEFHALLGK